MLFDSPDEVKLMLAGDTVSVAAGAAACETETVCVLPPPVRVTVPLRALPVLAAAVTETVPLLLPEAGETVIHESDLVTDQFVLDVTEILFDSPDEVKLMLAGDMVSVAAGAAACETETVCVLPSPVRVTVPVRALPVLAAAVTETVPLLLPEVGETVIHESDLETDQFELDVTEMLFDSPDEVKLMLAGDTVSVYVNPEACEI
jgi:hypothetical protein